MYIDIKKLKLKINIVSLIGSYVELKKIGSGIYRGLCPFHNEQKPSFTVYEDSQRYFCYGCGAKGDAIDFLIKIENLTFSQAVKKLFKK